MTECTELPIHFLGHRWPINGFCEEIKQPCVVRVRCREALHIASQRLWREVIFVALLAEAFSLHLIHLEPVASRADPSPVALFSPAGRANRTTEQYGRAHCTADAAGDLDLLVFTASRLACIFAAFLAQLLLLIVDRP